MKIRVLVIFFCILFPLLFHPQVLAQRQPQALQLDNGLTLILEEDRLIDIISMQVFVVGGKLQERAENQGITTFLSRIIYKGAGERTARDIAEGFDALGSHFDISVIDDFIFLTLQAPAETFMKSLEILFDIITAPTFPAEEVERERRLLLRDIERREDDLFTSTYELFQTTFYLTHEYRFSSLGTEEVISSLSGEDLISHFQKTWIPENMIVSVCGDFDPEILKEILAQRLAELPFREGIPLKLRGEPPPEEERKVVRHKSTHASWVIMGYPAPPVGSPDYAAMKVLNALMGTGMSSRLFREIREHQGLAYSVGSFYPSRLDDSHYVIYAILEPNKVEVTISAIKEEIERLQVEPVTGEELERAKRFLIGEHLLAQETRAGRAWRLAWFEALGRGYIYTDQYLEEIERIEAEEIKLLARSYLKIPTIVSIGPHEGKE